MWKEESVIPQGSYKLRPLQVGVVDGLWTVLFSWTLVFWLFCVDCISDNVGICLPLHLWNFSDIHREHKCSKYMDSFCLSYFIISFVSKNSLRIYHPYLYLTFGCKKRKNRVPVWVLYFWKERKNIQNIMCEKLPCKSKWRWWDLNPYVFSYGRFWVCCVCLFRHNAVRGIVWFRYLVIIFLQKDFWKKKKQSK